MLTKELCDELFEYRDGVLYWKVSKGNQVSIGTPAGTLHHSGYLQTKIKDKFYLNHRIIFLMCNGFLPKRIDHKDGDPMNNLISNLRGATQSQNRMNSRVYKSTASGVKGVSRSSSGNKWRVRIKINGKEIHIGSYNDIELATLVAEEARNKYHGEFARHA